MAKKYDKKRLSVLKYLMKCINEKAPDFPLCDSPSDTEVDEAFMSAISRFGELNKTLLGGARRVDQVSWTPAATFLRKSKRQRTS